jgi:hypothetical protein
MYGKIFIIVVFDASKKFLVVEHPAEVHAKLAVLVASLAR